MSFFGTIGKFLGSVFGGVGAAGISSAAGLIGSKQQFKWQKELNKDSYNYTLNLQKQAQQWQQHNITSAHQQEVADMRKAGLNPILSATGGSGASVGSVGGSSVGAGSAPSLDIDPVSAWATARNVKNETELRKSQVALQEDQAKLTRSQEKGAVWDALAKQQYYDEVQPLEAKKIQADIDNSTAVSSAQANYITAQTLGQNIENMYKADSMKAAINQATSSADFNRRRSSGYSYKFKAGPVEYDYSGDRITPPWEDPRFKKPRK